ncbi:MAG TPA: hypothetical protein PKX34_00590 [Candidatus Absconditabacterales bacterium]|nr:hypothetical protein [Candidatus Absconditabacterales bacterium]HPK27701.1 hypothetical protein [Candidatus Absconditabacterales bacterium]
MKKIFWTSIVWIVLFCVFILYMKFFNIPLATKFSNFLVGAQNEVVVETGDVAVDVEVEEESLLTTIVDEVDTIEETEGYINEEENTNWDNLFNQLDRIELSILKMNNISQPAVEATIQPENDEEIFDQFKVWYEENKKTVK